MCVISGVFQVIGPQLGLLYTDNLVRLVSGIIHRPVPSKYSQRAASKMSFLLRSPRGGAHPIRDLSAMSDPVYRTRTDSSRIHNGASSDPRRRRARRAHIEDTASFRDVGRTSARCKHDVTLTQTRRPGDANRTAHDANTTPSWCKHHAFPLCELCLLCCVNTPG